MALNVKNSYYPPSLFEPILRFGPTPFLARRRPKTAKNDQKMAKNGLTAIAGRDGWFSAVNGWIYPWDIPPSLLEPILKFGPTPFLAQRRPKMTQKMPKMTKKMPENGLTAIASQPKWLVLAQRRPKTAKNDQKNGQKPV